MRACNYCGENIEVKKTRKDGIHPASSAKYNRHINHCIVRLDMLNNLVNCRFCNTGCGHEYVFTHEQNCEKKKEFSPYLEVTDYYKDLVNFDFDDNLSLSKCRHCGKPYKTKNIFKHEENCMKQLNKTIGPAMEKVRCKYCRFNFYTVDNYVTYKNVKLREMEIVNVSIHQHEPKCKERYFREIDTERKVIRCSIKK